jgi:hypothetical protein
MITTRAAARAVGAAAVVGVVGVGLCELGADARQQLDGVGWEPHT